MSLPSEPESDDAFVISSETGESSDQSDSILSPRPGTKKRKARLKRRTTKRRAPPPPADDSDESISEGILGTGRRRRGASSAGASSGGTAKDKGKGKPDAPKPGEPIVVDSDNDSDASEKILVRTPPKVKGETVDMGTYTLAEDTARGGPSGSVGNAVKLEPEADVEMVDDAAEIQEEARAERFERIGVIRTNITGIRYCRSFHIGIFIELPNA